MTSQLIGVPRHPVAAFAERLNTRLDDLGQMGLTTMSPEEKREALVALAVGRAKADALYLRLLGEADASQVCLEAGAADASGSWRLRPARPAAKPAVISSWPSDWRPMPVLAAGMDRGAGEHRPGTGDRERSRLPARAG